MTKEISDPNQVSVSDDQVESNKEDVVKYETYSKATKDLHRWKSTAKEQDAAIQELNEKLKTYELSQAENEGRKDDVIKSLRDELNQTKTQLKEKEKTYAYSVVSEQLKREAVNQGCVNPDKLIRLMSTEDLKSIEVDDGFAINSDDLSRVIAKAKEENSDIGLFGAKKVNIHDINIKGAPTGPKPVSEMSKEELENYARENL